MITRRQQAEASRAALIEAAIEEFAGGYEQATVAMILQRCGMAKGALYHYFPGGKRDIFAAVVEELDADWHRDLAERPEKDPVDRILAGVKAYFRYCSDRRFRQIVLIDAPSQFPERWNSSEEYEALRTELEALALDGRLSVDVGAATDALFGSIERCGLALASAQHPTVAAATSLQVVERLIRGVTEA